MVKKYYVDKLAGHVSSGSSAIEVLEKPAKEKHDASQLKKRLGRHAKMKPLSQNLKNDWISN
jgi:hypothetical protein